MKWFPLLLAAAIATSNTFGQAPSIQWQKCYGGSLGEYLSSLIATNDGGYIMGGTSGSNDGDATFNQGLRDFWIMKVNAQGALVWQKSYGGSQQDWCRALSNTSDGGVLALGSTASSDGNVSTNHGGDDVWLLKLDANGNLLWQKCYGGNGDDHAWALLERSNGDIVITGNTFSNDGDVNGSHGSGDAWLVGLTATGDLLWQQCYGGSNDDGFTSIISTATGYVLSGSTASNDGEVSGNHGQWDWWAVKLNNDLSIGWQKCIGGENDDLDVVNIAQSTDGGIALSGFTNSTSGDISGHNGADDNRDYWVVKLAEFLSVESPQAEANPRDPYGIITTEITLDNLSASTSVSIYDALGRSVKPWSISYNQIDVSQLLPGMYILTVMNGKSMHTQMFCKQ